MGEERELLSTRVFPKLRSLCAARNVVLNEVDLRWGISSEESASGRVLQLCLGEVDRCRPFFVCLLGERYGWSHAIRETDELLDRTFANAQERYPWITDYKDRSITELEIRHAALNDPPASDPAQQEPQQPQQTTRPHREASVSSSSGFFGRKAAAATPAAVVPAPAPPFKMGPLFFFRDPAYVDTIAEERRHDFAAENEAAKARLQVHFFALF